MELVIKIRSHGDTLEPIRSHGETLEDRRVVENILRSFPAKFESIVVTIEETKNLS